MAGRISAYEVGRAFGVAQARGTGIAGKKAIKTVFRAVAAVFGGFAQAIAAFAAGARGICVIGDARSIDFADRSQAHRSGAALQPRISPKKFPGPGASAPVISTCCLRVGGAFHGT